MCVCVCARVRVMAVQQCVDVVYAYALAVSLNCASVGSNATTALLPVCVCARTARTAAAIDTHARARACDRCILRCRTPTDAHRLPVARSVVSL